MFTLDIKTLHKEYNTLSALVIKVNRNPLTDVITRARKISDEDISQSFSELHGRMVNATTKNIGNLIFVIILDDIKNVLELSPTIGIKDPNGKVVLIWNIKDEIVTFLPDNV